MRWALGNTSWNSGYRIVSYVQLGITLVLVATLFAWKANVSSETVATEGKPVGIKGALKIKGVPYLLIGFFAYCAAEGTAMVWASSYLVEARGVGKETAAGFAALFYIGITAGRFASGFISEKLGDKNMIRLGTLVALVGVVLLVLPISHNLPSLVGLVVIGVGCAPVYPSIIHSTPGNFGAENSQAIIGIQMASAYVGSTFIPPLFGLIANHIDIKLFPWYILIFFVLMIVMTEKTFKKVGR
jgi:fucose permease